jgi:hypothetical protein
MVSEPHLEFHQKVVMVETAESLLLHPWDCKEMQSLIGIDLGWMLIQYWRMMVEYLTSLCSLGILHFPLVQSR